MKKYLYRFFSFTLVLLCLCAVAHAAITLPDSLQIIEAEAFYGDTSIGKVVVPEGTTEIRSKAFANSSLTELVLPASLTFIAEDAFVGCKNVVFIVDANTIGESYARQYGIPYRYTQVPEATPQKCFIYTIENGYCTITGIFRYPRSVIIPDEIDGYPVVKIGHHAFTQTEVSSVYIPDSVRIIEDSAFSDCKNLINIHIPETVNTIGAGAFGNCEKLRSIHLPDGITSIGNATFMECRSLTRINLPQSIATIGEYAFYFCESLTEIIIPEGVSSISAYTFQGCKSLKDISIPYSVTSVDNGAFAACTDLVTISFPGKVTSVGHSVFAGCHSLTSVSMPGGIPNVNEQFFKGCTSLKSITISQNATIIGDKAFKQCTQLSSLVIPNGILSIGSYAFTDCDSLSRIELPDSISSIGQHAFADCTNLKRVIMPDALTALGYYAFFECTNLRYIDMPKTMYCDIDISTFENCTNLYQINMPSEMFGTIKENAFSNCSALRKIIIPSGVTTIESLAFIDCTNLKGIMIPDTVTSIGVHAFSYCNDLIIYGTPGSYAETYAESGSIKAFPFLPSSSWPQVEDPEDVPDTPIPSTDYYTIVNDYFYGGKVYGEAVLTKEHNGVSAGNFFFVDANGKVITDPETLCALWTMWMYKEMWSSITVNINDLNDIAKIWSATATEFMQKETLWATGGTIAGEIVKAYLSGGTSFLKLLQGAIIDNALDGNEVSAWLEIATIDETLDYMDKLVAAFNGYEATNNNGIYVYDHIKMKLDLYVNYLYSYEVANGLCKPVIEKVLYNFENDNQVGLYFLYTMLDQMVGSFPIAGAFQNVAKMCATGDINAWTIINSLFADMDALKPLEQTVETASKYLGRITDVLRTVSNLEDSFILEENDWLEPYFKTPGEIVDSEFYQNHLLLAQ